MRMNLLQLEQRVKELETLADEVGKLAERLTANRDAQPDLSIKGQAWFRGARELLVQQKSSALGEFEACYIRWIDMASFGKQRASIDIEQYIKQCVGLGKKIPSRADYNRFDSEFRNARSLVQSAIEEVKSRELPVITALSFALSADEFDKADELLSQASGEEVIIRASGVVARVAIERHLFTVADTRGIPVPASKGKAMAGDAINALKKANIITAIQKSELEGLFTIANHCAHPKESVSEKEVSRLIQRGKELASVIL